MPKYLVDMGWTVHVVTAETYYIRDGFITFEDGVKTPVASFSAGQVSKIQREGAVAEGPPKYASPAVTTPEGEWATPGLGAISDTPLYEKTTEQWWPPLAGASEESAVLEAPSLTPSLEMPIPGTPIPGAPGLGTAGLEAGAEQWWPPVVTSVEEEAPAPVPQAEPLAPPVAPGRDRPAPVPPAEQAPAAEAEGAPEPAAETEQWWITGDTGVVEDASPADPDAPRRRLPRAGHIRMAEERAVTRPRVTRMELWAAEEEATPRPEPARPEPARAEFRPEPPPLEVRAQVEARPEVRTELDAGFEAEEKPVPPPEPEAERPEGEHRIIPPPEPRIDPEWGQEETGLARRRMAKAPLEGMPGERAVPRRTTQADLEWQAVQAAVEAVVEAAVEASMAPNDELD